MTKTQRITRAVIIGVILIAVGWDIHVAWNAKPGDTISEMVLFFVMKHPTIPFLVGYIMGHLFWPQKEV
jgi:hypothetical protein